jgi:hypothetical protein
LDGDGQDQKLQYRQPKFDILIFSDVHLRQIYRMSDKSTDPAEDKVSLLQRWRMMFFPIRPADSAAQKMFKHSAFFLFAVMVLLITAPIGIALFFTL